VGIEEVIESRIQEAMKAGVFSNLPGEGKPLVFDKAEQLAGDQWMGFKLLRDASLLPEWLMLAKEIERSVNELAEIESRHGAHVAMARETGDWERYFPAILHERERFVQLARETRAKQDQFNFDAPSVHLERPGIWIERRLERMDARVSSPNPSFAP
jgi:hypothetical protein